MSVLLNLPRELREDILHHLILPTTIYMSSAEADAHSLNQHDSKKYDKTYVDTRIYLPSRPPANILSTCRQLRLESLHYHAHMLNSSAMLAIDHQGPRQATKSRVAERSDSVFDEAAESTVDDGMTLRLTLEVQRGCRGSFGGYFIPDRVHLSPRFLALLPLMKPTRRLKMVIWPGFDWWNGPKKDSPLEQWRQRKALLKRANFDQVVHSEQLRNTESTKEGESTDPNPKLDAVSVAVRKILGQLPAIEELELSIFIATGDLFRWDLPDVKWEKVQPWLDMPVAEHKYQQLQKVTRKLTSVWQKPEVEVASQQAFYVQTETRIHVCGSTWRVERQGGLRAVSDAELNNGDCA